MATLVPPIKCQGIKTKLIPVLKQIIPPHQTLKGRWLEPFCGSGVVALNIAPRCALLSDTNIHIIRFYEELRLGKISPAAVRVHLEAENVRLRAGGQEYYNSVRDKFNEHGESLDFLFLNRACFNGVMRFNRQGRFNVPFCHKLERFAQAYTTKIVNQVRVFQDAIRAREWRFVPLDFREILAQATEEDFMYLDPPYFGRHVDYYNSWSMKDEDDLTQWLRNAPCRWALSTWHSNQYRRNETAAFWESLGYYIQKVEHFYHVGSNEDLRHSMTEAIVTNFKTEGSTQSFRPNESSQLALSLV